LRTRLTRLFLDLREADELSFPPQTLTTFILSWFQSSWMTQFLFLN
jgi:hypothetical protein